ncbi:DELLA protein 2-like [Gossypium hirsutum]|uniref:DELLA protein 2-like n=1 Tax=Gossypium hirsutum TaxID=3635 RepID=A0ABM2ZRT6_GOSHI|nr:DELLA protein 2-like [Gossypium hirsutum]
MTPLFFSLKIENNERKKSILLNFQPAFFMAYSFSDIALGLLLYSAKAIEDGDLKRADVLLHNILIPADQRPKYCGNQNRVVKYFAEALVRRAYGLHPSSSHFSFPRRLHLVDFSIPYYCFEDSVLRTLPTLCDRLSARVSYILPPFLKKHVDFKRSREEAKELEKKLGDEFKVVYANSLAEVDECEIDFKRSREDEMVVVYYKFKLHKLLIDAKAMKRELVRLREINPTAVIMLDFYGNHNDSNFLRCLEDSFQYYSNSSIYFDDEYQWELSRDAWEGTNVIRRHPTLSEIWQRLFSMAGFTRIPLIHNKDILVVQDKCLLEIMGVEEECLIIGYKKCTMFFLSAWKPNVEDGHFNSSSTSHKFGQGPAGRRMKKKVPSKPRADLPRASLATKGRRPGLTSPEEMEQGGDIHLAHTAKGSVI